MLYQSKSQSDARTATANLKRRRALLCPHTSKVRSIPDGRGMASDPVNGPGSVRRKAAVLLFPNGTTRITICSGIPNLWHAQNAPSELGEEVVLPTTSRTLIQTTKSQVVTSSNKPIAKFLNCKKLFSIAFGSSPYAGAGNCHVRSMSRHFCLHVYFKTNFRVVFPVRIESPSYVRFLPMTRQIASTI